MHLILPNDASEQASADFVCVIILLIPCFYLVIVRWFNVTIFPMTVVCAAVPCAAVAYVTVVCAAVPYGAVVCVTFLYDTISHFWSKKDNTN